MGIFSARLAAKSEYRQLFLICLIPVNVWAIVVFLQRVPTLVLQMSVPEIAGVAAYILAFALVESLFVFGLLFIASILLPKRFFQSRLVPVGALFMLVASLSAVFIHLYRGLEVSIVQFNVWAASWTVLGLASTGLSVSWVRRSEKAGRVVQAAVERLSPLALSYLLVDVLGLVVIVARNLI